MRARGGGAHGVAAMGSWTSAETPTAPSELEIAIVGGGASGASLALHLARLRPNWPIALIDDGEICGRGLAYGRCGPRHLLNVPVARMDIGIAPAFNSWLGADAPGDAFVPRARFGAYLSERLLAMCAASGLRPVRGRVVRILDGPNRGVRLADGRIIPADRVVLAIGNLPPASPLPAASTIGDTALYVADPWRGDALEGLGEHDDVALIGTGLTMVDLAATLLARGHKGAIHAVSRRGLLPRAHEAGGAWRPFLGETPPGSPRAAIHALRAEVRKAQAQSIPWQRVIDAARPDIGRLWNAWNTEMRAQFLRHGRAHWDIHRHRMAPDLAARIHEAIETGQLIITTGRIVSAEAKAGGAELLIDRRSGGRTVLSAARIINCTGPNADLREAPVIDDLQRRGLVRADALKLGIETNECAVVHADGATSSWLYAIGPLTRPAWWEITAMPEIAVQTRRLAEALAQAEPAGARASIAEEFLELGAGI